MRKLNNQKFTTGFTLIELLVVIAIIGILSGIVLTSLGTARTKAKDSATQAALAGLRSQMEVVSTNGNYGTAGTGTVDSDGTATGLSGTCNDTQSINILKNAASNAGKTMNCVVGLSGNTWVAYGTLSSQTSPANYCVDSSGNSDSLSAAPSAVAITGAVKCK